MAADLIEEREDHRRAVVRNALLYTPAAAVSVALLLISVTNGAWIAMVILAIIALALVFEAQGALRDLRASPTVTRGQVRRVWSKAMVLFFGKSHYVLVDRQVFGVNGITAAEVKAGDTVEIEHWPHTNTLISLRLVERGGGGGGGGAGAPPSRERGGW